MNIVTLLQPPHLVFGNGCAPQAADFLARRGVKRVLLVTSKSVRPQITPLVDALKKTSATSSRRDSFPPSPRFFFFKRLSLRPVAPGWTPSLPWAAAA